MLAALTAAGSVIAQAPPAPSVAASATPAARSADTGKTQGWPGKKMDKSTKVEMNPDAALIEYLGEYGDTADGLDPMGLADPDAPPTKSAGDKE